MKVLFDMTFTGTSEYGVGVYAQQLIRSVRKVSPQVEISIVSGVPILNRLGANGQARNTIGKISRIIRVTVGTQIWVPLQEKMKGVQIVHAPSFFASCYGSKPLVLTMHDIDYLNNRDSYGFLSRDYIFPMIPRSISRASAIIAVSENTKREILENYDIFPGKIHVTYHGVDARYRPCDEKNRVREGLRKFGIEHRYFLHVGSWAARKNLPFLIHAFEKYLSLTHDPETILVLAGKRLPNLVGGEEITQAIEASSFRNRILQIAPIVSGDPPQVCPELYQGAEALIFPSIYEGFGLPPLEAMACGVPVITSNTSSLPEIVADAGIMIDPYKENELVEALIRFKSDNGLQAHLIEAGLRRASNFTWERTAKETLAVYDRVLCFDKR